MNHKEFVNAYNAGQLIIKVDKFLPAWIFKMLPLRYRLAIIFWSSIANLSIPGFLVIGYLYNWIIGILLLIFFTPILWKSAKTSNLQFIIDFSLENAAFYQFATQNNIMIVIHKD